MELIHQAMLSQFMSRKLMSESVANKMLETLAEEGGDAPPLAAVVSTINKELGAMGMQVGSTDNAPGGEKHYAIVDTGTEQSSLSQLATTFSQPELEMFQKIVRHPTGTAALVSLPPALIVAVRFLVRLVCRR